MTVRVAYLVSQYPALSHAFIETEVEALRELGAEVHTFSVRSSRPEELLTERARRDAATTTVLQSSPATRVPRALLALLARSPGALLAAVRQGLRSGPPSVRARLRQLFYVLEAVVLWHGMRRARLRHVHVHFANNGADIARLAVTLGTAVDGPARPWSWSLAMHGPTEFEDRTHYDLPAKVASAAWVACITDFCRSQVMRMLPPADWPKAQVVRMAVDTARYRPADDDAAREPGAPLRILTVGRLVPEKGAPLLLDALDQLRSRGVPATLALVGSGPLREQLAAMVEERGLQDVVELVGPVGQEHLPDVYRQADVFVLPSFAEGLPVVLMEAVATGLPVVSTAIAGIPELVRHRRTGMLLPAGRADLIADALAELAGDPELAQELGRQGRAVVERDHDRLGNARRLLELMGGAPHAS